MSELVTISVDYFNGDGHQPDRLHTYFADTPGYIITGSIIPIDVQPGLYINRDELNQAVGVTATGLFFPRETSRLSAAKFYVGMSVLEILRQAAIRDMKFSSDVKITLNEFSGIRDAIEQEIILDGLRRREHSQ